MNLNHEELRAIVSHCGGDTARLEDLDAVPYRIEITTDEFPESPRSWDNLGTMVCWHSRYNLGDDDGVSTLISDIRSSGRYRESWEYGEDGEELEYASPSRLMELAHQCGFEMLPVYLYDHSGITLKTSPFSCPWDSGMVGFIEPPRGNFRLQPGEESRP